MEIAIIILTSLIGLIAAVFDTRKERLIVRQEGDKLIEFKDKKTGFWGYVIIAMSVAVVLLSIINKSDVDKLKASEKAEIKRVNLDLMRASHPIEPITIIYKTEVDLKKLSNFHSFSLLSDSIEKNNPTLSDSMYFDSNDPVLHVYLKDYDYDNIFRPIAILSFCENPKDHFDINKSLMFLSNFEDRSLGKNNQDLKLEITYYKAEKKFKVYYISRTGYNLRKGFIKNVTSLIDLPNKYIVCSGFNNGVELKAIILETGISRDRTTFTKIEFDSMKGYFFHKIDSAEIAYP